MINFRASVLGRSLSAALTLFLGIAVAEAAGPTPLHTDEAAPSSGVPSVEEAPPPSPVSESPPAAEVPQVPDSNALQTVGARPGVNEATVQVGTLGAPDTAGMGLMGADSEGLPPAMWSGTSLATASKLLQVGPRPTTSRALQVLGRKVLLSQAEPPRGEAAGPSFLTLRLRRLLDLGDLDAVIQLTSNVQAAAKTNGEQMVRADAFLIRGSESDACDLAANMRRFNADPFWVKLGAFCALRAGKTEAAELSVNLLRLNGVEDPVFYALYDRLAVPSANQNAPAPATDASALSHAMARAGGFGTLDPAKFADRPVYLRVIALSTGGTADGRLAAALAAAKVGALPVASLRAMFALQGFGETQLNFPESAAGSVEPSRVPALFYQSVQLAASPEPRLTRAVSAYRSARARALGPLMAELMVPAVEPIIASPDFVNSAGDMVELYLAANAPTPAYDWFDIIDPRREIPGLDKARLDHLAAMLRISAPSEKLTWTPKDVDRLVSRANKQGGDAPAQRAFEINLLASLGYQVDPEIWTKLPTVAPANDGLLRPKISAFEEAAAGGRIAESCLLALDALGASGPARAPQSAVITVVRGLNSLGLEADARAIALEAALGAPSGGS